MKKIIFLFLLLVVSATSMILSCRKEKSCEGCLSNNKPPIAIAGVDMMIFLPLDSITIDGGASYDPDGSIREYLWSKIAGPSSLITSNPKSSANKIKNLVQGSYSFELQVTDNGGLVSKDTVIVTVSSLFATNHPPNAFAGDDQTIIWPINSALLDGSRSSDPDYNIHSYKWTNISGPPSFTIVDSNAVQTQVTNLTEGVYLFELTVTDAALLVTKDTVKINVIATGIAIFTDLRWLYICYDPRPGVCWINSDGPSYGLFIKDTLNIIPRSANAIAGVWIKMDTSSVWEKVPGNCWKIPDPYPQTNFTYCLTTDSLRVDSWFFSWENLEGRKADVKILF